MVLILQHELCKAGNLCRVNAIISYVFLNEEDRDVLNTDCHLRSKVLSVPD